MARRASQPTISSNYVDPGPHPGFINLGNTCFLNSVLQATSATQSLKQLLHPDEIIDEQTIRYLRGQSSSTSSDKSAIHDLLSSELIKQLSERSKSPVLQLVDEENRRALSTPVSRRPSSTNDHSLIASALSSGNTVNEAGDSMSNSSRSSLDSKRYEPKSGDLPLTTAFRQVLERSWNGQELSAGAKSKASRPKAPSINPKRLLNAMASKYDQYGEYGQQDGHELLRHLLDSLRMEEMDIIKKIRPPTPADAKKNHRRLSGTSEKGKSKEESLQPFVDNIFCGKLLSCVVCEGCRHVSHCYEDFYDLSLSLRPDTDAKNAGKRDRMRSMADKWKRATGSKTVNGAPSRVTPSDSLAILTDGLMGSVSDTEEVEEKTERSSSRTGRSINRPKSAAAGQNPAVIDANSRDSAKTFMMKNLQPKTSNGNAPELALDKLSLNSQSPEERKSGQGAVSLLRAVSTRSRPSSRGPSPIREEIRELVDGEQPHHHHHHLLRHEHKPKQSKQGVYLAKLLTEAPPPAPLTQTSALLWGRRTPGPAAADPQNDSNQRRMSEGTMGDIEAQQASTGLVRALHQFTSVEVLDGPNSFACKRCWRILNPPTVEEKLKLRLRRMRRGKDEDESERSSDDEASSDEEVKEEKQLQELSASRPQSTASITSVSDAASEKLQRPPVRANAEWTDTITPEQMCKASIPTIETTSPTSPISPDDEKRHGGEQAPAIAPPLRAPKPRLAGSRGITLGESASSASSEDEVSNEGTDVSREEEDGPAPTSIKQEEKTVIPAKDLRPNGNGVIRKRSIHSLQRRALKRFLVSGTPKVFVFHFKRFQASTRGFSSYSFSSSFKKIDDYVSFPEYLDVKPWLAPPREEYTRDGRLKLSSDSRALDRANRDELEDVQAQDRDRRHHRWGWRSRPAARVAPEKRNDGVEERTKYKLYAVIVHQGSMSGGHYTAYVLSDRIKDSKATTTTGTASPIASQTPTAATTPQPLSEEKNAASESADLRTVNGKLADSAISGQHSSTSKSSLDSVVQNETLSDVASNSNRQTSSDGESSRGEITASSKAAASSVNGTQFTAHAGPATDSSACSSKMPKKDRRRWIYTSDTVVRGATIEEVLKAQAYMLFYEQM